MARQVRFRTWELSISKRSSRPECCVRERLPRRPRLRPVARREFPQGAVDFHRGVGAVDQEGLRRPPQRLAGCATGDAAARGQQGRGQAGPVYARSRAANFHRARREFPQGRCRYTFCGNPGIAPSGPARRPLARTEHGHTVARASTPGSPSRKGQRVTCSCAHTESNGHRSAVWKFGVSQDFTVPRAHPPGPDLPAVAFRRQPPNQPPVARDCRSLCQPRGSPCRGTIARTSSRRTRVL